MAETRRRKCHSCREWMEETRRGILQAPGSIADAATPRHTARFCLMLLTDPGFTPQHRLHAGKIIHDIQLVPSLRRGKREH